MTEFAPGHRIGPYTIRRMLGSGGMGVVYLASDSRAARDVAIKVLPPSALDVAGARDRFRREARLASQLDHPNVVRVYDHGSLDGLEFLVMEYVQGETLEVVLSRGPLRAESVLHLGIQVARALEAAHAIGLVHRDVKPSNLLLAPDGAVKVADFGLAKRAVPGEAGAAPGTRTETRLTRTGQIVGTTAFMSPEQTRGEPVDARSDIFSLGCVLYEAAAGRSAFRGATAHEIAHAVVALEPMPPGLLRGDLPLSLERVVLRCLAKRPEDRYPSARALASALEEARASEPGLESRDPSIAVAEDRRPQVPPHRLPVPTTTFVGRGRERAEIRNRLSTARLVTLIGTGGCGKTRLGIQVAHDVLESFADGAWFVDLSEIGEARRVVEAVASTLGVREEARRDRGESLAAHCRPRRFLLVLDNCEHVLATCAALVSQLLDAAPGVRVLATSREALGLPREERFSVPPLGLPDPDRVSGATAEELLEHESIRLFLDRARAAHPGFTADPATLPVVARICLRLEGIPLALELAAARVRALPLRELLARLEDRLAVLAGGAPAIQRHATLRSVIQWSVALLSEEERRLFARLGVFRGGASLEGVEVVCAGKDVGAQDVLNLLSGLIEKSLLSPEEGVGGEARYRFLEMLREYAEERLRESGEEAEVACAHEGYFLGIAERGETELEGAAQREWLDRLEREHENLRRALTSLMERGETGAALRLVGALGRFWWLHGHWTEGGAKIEEMLARCGEGAPAEARAKALLGAGRLRRERGDYPAARTFYEAGRRLYRELGDRLGYAMAATHLGLTLQAQGELEQARVLFEEALATQKLLGNRRAVSISLYSLGRLAEEIGDYGAARNYYRESLETRREIGDSRGVGISLVGLGNVALLQGDPSAARAELLRGLAIQRDLGDRQGSAYTLASLGTAAIGLGDLAAARMHLGEALEVHRETGDRLGIAITLDALAELAAAEGESQRCLKLLGAADSIYGSLGARRIVGDADRMDRCRRQAAAALDDEEGARAFAEGETLGMEAAIRYAGVTGSPSPGRRPGGESAPISSEAPSPRRTS